MKTHLATSSALRVSFALLLLLVSSGPTPTSALSQRGSSAVSSVAPSLQVERVSVASDGTQGNDLSGVYWAYISSDGRYVSFGSLASNLVLDDTNGVSDFFTYDRQTKQTERISVASDGTQGNSSSVNAIASSADGRYVAFSSYASNLIPNDTNGNQDVFVRDRQTGQTQIVSVASDGSQGNAPSGYSVVSISDDGRYVAFYSAASNLVPNDTNGQSDAFVHDRQTGQTQRISVATDGTQGNGFSGLDDLSANGRYVVFTSAASNLVSGDTNGVLDVFVHDRQTGQTIRASVASDGSQANGISRLGTVSADGRYVALLSAGSNLVPGDTNGKDDIFVHDTTTGLTTRVSVASDGTQANDHNRDGCGSSASISRDGNYVAFDSSATTLVSGDTNGVLDTFVHNRQTGQTIRVSVASDGTQANGSSGGGCRRPTISSGDTLIAFSSDASNLVPGDTNAKRDVFVAEILAWPAYSVSGRVVDGNNNPIANVTIADGAGHTPTTDSSGNYTLSGLPADTYTITPSKSGYTFSPASRAVGVPPSKTGYDFVGVLSVPQTCDVPFLSQRDESWRDHPLRTSGACSPECNTIGACGCTLTSAAMIFSYYGASLNPPALSDCMGTSACPFSWGSGAACTGGNAVFVGRYSFSWNRLDQELYQNHRPIMLGMHRKGDSGATHWVVVVSGHGSDPDNYSIHDPWFLGGASMPLTARTRDYDLDWISVYGGEPSCAAVPSTLRPTALSLGSPSVEPPIVTGTALVYRMDEVEMTVQLIAQSTAGDIKEMLVWTDEMTNPSWQTFSTLIELPVSDHVYARFRDGFGNESGQAADTIFPADTPQNPPLNIFLPMILR
jgi:hypothetical protein